MTENYSELISQEKEFWADYDETNLKHGIPHWLDLQNAQLLDEDLVGPWADPQVENIFFGHYKKRLIDICVVNGGQILELGCGSGWLCLELARRGLDVTGLDASERRLKLAAKTAEKNHQHINYICQDLNTDVRLDNKYDIVIAWLSLHHFLEIKRILPNLKRNVLKKNGIFLMVDHKRNWFRKIVDYMNSKWIRKGKIERSPFEDVHTEILPELLNHLFQTDTFDTFHSFSKICIEILYFFSIYRWMPKKLIYALCKTLVFFDKIVCQLFKKSGEMYFMVLLNR